MNKIAKFVIGGLLAGYALIAGTVYYVSPQTAVKTEPAVVSRPEPVKPAETQVKPDLGKELRVPAEAPVAKVAELPSAPVAEAPAAAPVPEPVVEEKSKLIPKIKEIINKIKPKPRVVEEEDAPAPAPAPKRVEPKQEPLPLPKAKIVETEAPTKKSRAVDWSIRNPREWRTGDCSSANDVEFKKECEWHRNILPHRNNGNSDIPISGGRG